VHYTTGNATAPVARANALQHTKHTEQAMQGQHGRVPTHCKELQHTAMHAKQTMQGQQRQVPTHYDRHCNALQHTATRCNTLQRAATRCNALPQAATHPQQATQGQQRRAMAR